MYIGIKHLHSFVAYITLLMILLSIIYVIWGWLGNKPFNKKSKLISMFGLAALHFQVLFGVILYFISPMGFSNFSKESMSNSIMRLFILEHPLIMIVAAILVTIGYSKAKRKDNSTQKYKLLSLFYLLGFILILSRIPWASWW